MSGPGTSRGDAPLHAFGAALRAAKLHRRRLRNAGLSIGVLAGALALTLAVPPAPRLVWNASPSAPVGLYLVSPGAEILPGDMVIARLPQPWRDLAASRHYLPSNVPLVKRVVGYPGREICALGSGIFLDGVPLVRRQARDGHGRTMPWWSGCRRLQRGQYFLLMKDRPDSFDGRYFGVTQSADIVGPAYMLWAR